MSVFCVVLNTKESIRYTTTFKADFFLFYVLTIEKDAPRLGHYRMLCQFVKDSTLVTGESFL